MVWKYRTEQDVEHVSNYLKDKGLSFIFDDRLPAFYIDHPDPEKHYMCKDIETLVDKYILKENE